MTLEQIESLERDAARMQAPADESRNLKGMDIRLIAVPFIRLTAWNWRRVARAERKRIGA